MYLQPLTGAWQFRQANTGDWFPAQVPGGVHTDLLALGRIPDPFVGDNEKRVLWVAESDWEYRRTFTADSAVLAEDYVSLVCDGLDTLAEVTLNGQLLGKTENMFRQYHWEVKPLLREGENELVIAFSSPMQYTTARHAERPLPGPAQSIAGGPHLRKAPCQFGWDWGPQLPPIGIWKDIRLEGRSIARLADIHLRQHHADGAVEVEAEVKVERWSDASSKIPARELTVTLRVTAPDGASVEKSSEVSQASEVSLSVPIADPQLWWPNGYGDQPLYKVDVVLSTTGVILSADDVTLSEARELDRRTCQIGLRIIELRQQPDEWGRSFQFVVNPQGASGSGVPIFAKGANWIPADSFPTRISDAYLEGLVRSTAEAHQNMLRVWGGGLYEEERFYDLCDRYGILVWQEFIFSCSIYPLDDPAFVENVHAEAVENIRRLRHHACLALWCGNNEMEWGWESWGWAKPDYEDELRAFAEKIPALRPLLRMADAQKLLPDWKELRDAYERFFHVTLPGWVAQEDPDRPYWPSSPSSNTPFEDVNGQAQGDAHYWDVWHGRRPFTAYRDQYPRFMSEFGFQSLPPLPTIQTYAAPADWNMTSYIMEHHQRSASGNGLMLGQMTDTFRMPKDFSSLVYLSMVLQAEGIRYGVEHWRRNMHRIAGTLYWQLNDCWPVASWSSLDYFGRWKALHYAARRFFAPVLLSIEDQGTSMGIHVSSDLREPWQGTVHWSLETLAGEVLESGEEQVDAKPLASTPVRVLDFGDRAVADKIPGLLGGNRRDLVFVCELRQGDRLEARKAVTFVPNKHLELTDPGLEVSVRQEEDRLAFDVTARSLARFVELTLEGADAVFSPPSTGSELALNAVKGQALAGIFDDNYFDLPAGRTATVTCPLPAGWTVEQAQAALRVRSLYDSFA